MNIALFADFLEEKWHSMDVAAEMLVRFSDVRHFEGPNEALALELIRPPMRRRFSWNNKGTGFTIDRLLNRFYDYPRFASQLRRQYSLFHIIDHSYSQLAHALPPERIIITCHDIDTFRCLWEPDQGGRSYGFVRMTRRILSGFKRAAHVCCDSIATRDEIVRHDLVSAEKMSVVPLGVAPVFGQEAARITEQEVDDLLRSFPRSSTATVDILHVGSVMARKRLDVLLHVFARVREQEPRARLLRVGGALDHAQQALASRLGLFDSICCLPFLTSEQLAVVYRRSAILLLPSAREGFGFPILEAMASGTPVLVSDLPALREVGGTAAEYAPIGQIEAWVGKLNGLLTERRDQPSQWQARRERCLGQARKFTWIETARRMADIYENFADVAKRFPPRTNRFH